MYISDLISDSEEQAKGNFFLHFLSFFFFLKGWRSHYIAVCPRIHYVDQGGLKLKKTLLPLSP